MEERIQKLLSAAGICSRRTAETYITAGRVTVNGRPAALGERADLERDDICVDGKRLQSKTERVYLLLNKPRGYVTTLQDEKGRKTVAELVKDCGARVWPVGRLDMDSEGLLLMTNDGELTRRLLELDRGVTLLQGKGAYSGKDKQVILCACARTQIIPVKRAVQEIDPDAFVIVCDAHEILGEGFGVYAPGGL